jgi:hypothetical protein
MEDDSLDPILARMIMPASDWLMEDDELDQIMASINIELQQLVSEIIDEFLEVPVDVDELSQILDDAPAADDSGSMADKEILAALDHGIIF